MLQWQENSNNSTPYSKSKNCYKLQKEKANPCIKHFSSQCNPSPNDNKFLENQTCVTEIQLSSFDIEDWDIWKIIKTLNINKVHKHDEVSIKIFFD